MFHLCAYSEEIDTGGVLTPIAAVTDPAMTVSGDNIQIPDYTNYLNGVFVIGSHVTQAQLQAPSLRRFVNYDIAPLNRNITTFPANRVIHLMDTPIQLDAGEQMQAFVAEDASGASNVSVFVYLSDGAITQVSGEIYTVRVTSATATNPFQWTNGSILFDQVLPVGRYALVGASFYASGLYAFRFLFQGSTPRPGGIGCMTVNDVADIYQRFGKLGVWGEFESTTPPTVDFFATSAISSEVGYLDLIRIG